MVRPDVSPRAARRILICIIALAALLRVVQAARLECISRDGAFYVKFAGELADHPVLAMREERAQPGYSALLLGMQRLIGPWLSRDGPMASERTGQLLAGLAGVAIIPLIFVLSAVLFDRRVGLWAAGLAALWPQGIELSADVLTDMPHLALYLAAILLIWFGVIRSHLSLLAAGGLVSGVAYLFRQEALALTLAGAAFALLTARPWVNRRSVGRAALLLACFAAPVAPYCVATGKLMHKKSVLQLLQPPPPELSASGRPGIFLARIVTPIATPWYAFEAWARSGQYVISTLALAGFFWPGGRPGQRSMCLLLGILVLLHVPAVLLRARSFGEFSSRYVVVLLALCLPWAGAALDRLIAAARDRTGWSGAGAILAGIVVVLSLPLRHGPNHGKLPYRTAGQWLNAHSRAGDVVAASPRMTQTLYYADRPPVWPPAEAGTIDERWRVIRHARPAWFVDEDEENDRERMPRDEADLALVERCRAEFGRGPVAYETGIGKNRRLRMYSTDRAAN